MSSKQVYEEALADIRKIKEVAEDNAKKSIIEAVTPRIRELIEQELLKEVSEEEVDDVNKDEEEKKDELLLGNKVVESDEKIEETEEKKEEEVEEGCHEGDDKVKEESVKFIKELELLENKVNSILNASKLIKESKGYFSLILENLEKIENMYSYIQKSAMFVDLGMVKESKEKLGSLYKSLKGIQEQNMSKKKLQEGDVTLKLTGLPDELDLESIGVDLITGEEEDGEASGEEEMPSDEDGEEVVDSEEVPEEGGEDMGDLDMDLDLGGEGEEVPEEEEENKFESRKLSDNVILEIDENMLKREISRLRSIKEAKNAKKVISEMKEKSTKVAKLNDSVKNTDSKRLAETNVEKELRTKLAESNLRNAKYMHAIKLLQNESLTNKQKAKIMERFEVAKSVHEVEAAYKEGLDNFKKVNENKVLGSSSRSIISSTSTVSTPTINEGIETERWAKLAGLK